MFSKLSEAYARAYLDSGLCSAAALQRAFGAEVLYPSEFLDLYGLASDQLRAIAFPLLDPQWYRRVREFEGTGPNLLDDFFHAGLPAGVSPHPLVDLEYMKFMRPDLFDGERAPGDFYALFSENLVDPGPFFDIAYYRMHAKGQPASPAALIDYMLRGAADGVNPNPFVDAGRYQRRYTDVPADRLQAALHFITIGDAEGRSCGNAFDPLWYRDHYASETDSIRRPLWHFLRYGRFAGRLPHNYEGAPADAAGPAVVHIDEFVYKPTPERILASHAAIAAKIGRALRTSLEAFATRDVRPVAAADAEALLKTLLFRAFSKPAVDVVIPCYDEFDKTVECLAAIAKGATDVALNVCIVDDFSPDPRYELFAKVPGLTVIRNDVNLHFLKSCNVAYARLSAPYVLLLNNDAQIVGNAIEDLLAALESDRALAAAVPKMLYPNGRLQEAGCTIAADGTTGMVGVGDDPRLPQYNRDRDVPYGSAAALLLRRADVGDVLFDERFAPAYGEDVDLCVRLRAAGKRIRYVAGAEVVHHLSASTAAQSEKRRVQLARRNQHKLLEKWGSRLADDQKVRTLAFYLPQFHPTPENDLWWGKGFTEWTNVTKARPSYVGHYQPHLPTDLGFYDLRLIEAMEAQQQLARRYGIEGFVMYYYNFEGRRILGAPLENLLARGDADFSFCLCWANENWTKHWDGGSQSHALMTQDHGPETIAAIADDAIAAARLPQAIKVNGLPLYLIYRPLLLPDAKATCAYLRQRFAAAGFPGVYLCYVESMEAVEARIDPATIGFDAAVEFPPHGIAAPYTEQVTVVKPGFLGKVYDYAGTVVNFVARPQVPYKRFPTVFPGWDNTARQPLAHTTLEGATPPLFQAYVDAKLDYIDANFMGGERLLFVNAWNEWAEGAHLEPDRAFGHAWLRAIESAMSQRGIVV